MKVRELMSSEVHSCRTDDNLCVPARLLWEHDCGCVPVLDAQGVAVAMLTDRDICMAAYTSGRPLSELHARLAMSSALHSCRAEDEVEAVLERMRAQRVRRLPVVDADGRPIGLVSLNDLARAAAQPGPSRARDARLAAIGETLAEICAPRALVPVALEPACCCALARAPEPVGAA